MAAVQKLADDINALNADKVALFNSFSENKIHDAREVEFGEPTYSDVEGLASDVEALTDSEVYDLNGLLDAGKQLSDRPC